MAKKNVCVHFNKNDGSGVKEVHVAFYHLLTRCSLVKALNLSTSDANRLKFTTFNGEDLPLGHKEIPQDVYATLIEDEAESPGLILQSLEVSYQHLYHFHMSSPMCTWALNCSVRASSRTIYPTMWRFKDSLSSSSGSYLT
jgi:hypothetical protein